ncbi:MFS transporter [Herbaspirillum sp. LeCh32-8]|uniref:MFS transporter n=1 Tax=Herbaspirillum sp. LeCh32-8 TaxID=2821356 RepID=UPI001AE521BE|nr:MFS transporter [Herbaspirillum sp. LeCh32-8]MBP0597581.1 MFS transporter [Herbaspirillum sp. LeCh32-8]
MRTLFSTAAGRVLLTASAGCAMTVLDTNVVGIVLPAIARDLGASFADIEWVVSAYVLCFAALLLPAGSVADRYGRKRVFLCGIALFALASLACAWAPTAQALYAARALQGVGAAFLLAPALAVIGHAFHDEGERARAWAVWGGIMGLTMVLSPLIGGAINAALGWRWAFAVNLPICLALAAAVLRHIPESKNPAPRPLDVPGILSFSSAVFLLTWALITGPEHGWSSVACVVRVAGGAFLFALFIAVERRGAHPMLELSLFRSPGFVAAVAAMFAYAASAQVMASLLPQFLQNARGLSAAQAGLAMLPFALAMLLLPQLGRRLGTRMSSPRILALGLCVTALGNLLMIWAARSGSAWPTVLGMAVLGSGGGLLNGETQKAIMGNVPRDRAGMASGISTTSRFTGVLAGFAGLGAVLAEGARGAMLNALATLEGGRALAERFAERAMAGDFDDAARLYGHQGAGAVTLARHAYGLGFSHVFMAATLLALVAAAVVGWSLKRSSRPALASPAAAERFQQTPRS